MLLNDLRLQPLYIPDALPKWQAEFIAIARKENTLLLANGALEAVSARETLLRQLLEAADEYLSEEVDVSEAAKMLGTCEETIRRRVRSGTLQDVRSNNRQQMRLKREDVISGGQRATREYDPKADAQDIAKLKRGAA